MADNALAPASKRDLVTMDFADALEVYTPNFQAELPSHIPVERFKRTIITALNMSPDLRQADRRSLFNAAVKCAHDGLYPDGREAALVIYGGAVQYLPMIAGIRKRMRNTGEVLSATAEVVYRHDKFRYVKGENPHIEHEPPAIGAERGEPVGAYAIIKLANGEVLREVMAKADIERARAVNRSSSSASSPWVKWWDEMARKTVMRRCAKSAPTGSDLERLLARDDEPPEVADMREIPARPTRDQFIEADPEPEKPFAVADADGQVHEFDDAGSAVDALRALLLAGQAARGEDGIEAAWEDNAALISALRESGLIDLADEMLDHYAALLNDVRRKPDPPAMADAAGGAAPSPKAPASPAARLIVDPPAMADAAGGDRLAASSPPAARPRQTPHPRACGPHGRIDCHEPECRPPVVIVSQSGVVAEDLGFLHPEMERQEARAKTDWELLSTHLCSVAASLTTKQDIDDFSDAHREELTAMRMVNKAAAQRVANVLAEAEGRVFAKGRRA